MKVLGAIKKYRSAIVKTIIAFTTIATYISILRRLFVSGGQNQLFLTIDVYSLTSILYMSPEMCSENSYTRFILLFSGIMCMLSDLKMEEKTTAHNNKVPVKQSEPELSASSADIKPDSDRSNDLEANTKKEANPYDYPEDF